MQHFLRNTLLVSGISVCLAAPVLAQLPSVPPRHIVILIEENHSYSSVYGSSSAPNINALAASPYAAVFSNFKAITHPSQPNYLDLFAGNANGLTNDNPPAAGTYPFTTPNMCAELMAAGKTFITYSEGLPSVGYDGAAVGLYVRKHNPCTNWVATGTPGTNQYGPSVNQPFTAFPLSGNYASLPTVCYVVPNDVNDMHDGSDPAAIIAGDNWITHLDTLRQWAESNNTLYIISFDESYDTDPNNQVLTIFYGPMVKGGMYNENVNLFNLLRTIEDLYSLPTHAGAAATSTAITDCWRNDTATGVMNVTRETYSFQVAPNPASDVIRFTCDKPISDPASVTFFDVRGHIAGKYPISGTSLSVNTSGLANGVYFYKVANTSSIIGEGKFVIGHN